MNVELAQAWDDGISVAPSASAVAIFAQQSSRRRDGDGPPGRWKWPCMSDLPGLAAQIHRFRQSHPKVCQVVIWVQRLGDIAGQGEGHRAVEGQCGTRHLETLWRRGGPAPPSGPGAALVHDGTATDPDFVTFPGVETGRVTGPLNQVLCEVSPPARVQDGFHGKVVWRHDLLEFWAIESPLDLFTRGISHDIGNRTGVLHGFQAKDLLGPVTLVALRTGDGSCSSWPGRQVRVAESPGLPWVVDIAASTGIPILAPRWPSSRRAAPCQWHCDLWSYKCATGPSGRPRNAWSCWSSCGDESCHSVSFASAPPWHIWCHHSRWWRSLYLCSCWKGAACIPVPLSLCTASGGLSCMSFRMVCMVPGISVPHLLVRGRAQAYLENMSMQQKRYLVPSVASQYSLQSTSSHCSCSPQAWWSVFGGSGRAPAGTACNFPLLPGLFQWPYTSRPPAHSLETPTRLPAWLARR